MFFFKKGGARRFLLAGASQYINGRYEWVNIQDE